MPDFRPEDGADRSSLRRLEGGQFPTATGLVETLY